MSGSGKVYVIDPVDPNTGGRNSSNLDNGERELPEYLRSSDSGKESSGTGTSQGRAEEKSSGVPIILSYMAGPLSIFSTRRGRRSRLWTGTALFSVAVSIIVIWMWRGLSYWSTSDNPVGAVMLIAAVAAAVAGFSAWTRAVALAWRHEGPRIRRSPYAIRGSAAACVFGIIWPGMGLFLSGRTKRAAAALWAACITVVSLLILSRAGWLWRFNSHAGAFSVENAELEIVFIILTAAAALGGLAWIAQALDGARLAGRASSRKAISRRNWAAAALLLSVMAFGLFFRPAVIAEALDAAAEATGAEGFKIIPLQLSRAAMRLDPSRPSYVIRRIGLHEDMGDQAKADELRMDLVARLSPSLHLLEKEGIVRVTGRGNGDTIIPAAPDLGEEIGLGARAIPAELMILEWDIAPARP
jgi:hypothetical protein